MIRGKSMAADELESMLSQAQRLTPDEKLQLMKRLAEMVVGASRSQAPRPLMYGKYRDSPGPLSTEEDFQIAEWHPTETDLNGP
jgi:hypothetical protein